MSVSQKFLLIMALAWTFGATFTYLYHIFRTTLINETQNIFFLGGYDLLELFDSDEVSFLQQHTTVASLVGDSDLEEYFLYLCDHSHIVMPNTRHGAKNVYILLRQYAGIH